MMAFDRIVTALERHGQVVKVTGNTARTNCPAHDGQNGTGLQIARIEDRALVKCYSGGCDTADIMAALDLTTADLFDNPRPARTLGIPAHAVYRYDNGRSVIRSAAKEFRQTGTDNPPELFRLSKVVAAVAAGVTVYVVEGEQDVLALEELGVVATTSPQGAKHWSLVDPSPLFGGHVIVVPDDDEPGLSYAAAVVASLTGRVASIELRRAAVGKDASDHFTAGLGLDDLAPFELPQQPTRVLMEGEVHRGQLRMAYRLAGAFTDRLRFVHSIGWHCWDATRWCEDDRGEARRAVAEGVLRPGLREALELDRKERDELIVDVRRCETAAGVDGVLRLAESLPPFAVTVKQLDADPYLLNLQNGTFDLTHGVLRDHDPSDLLTKVAGAGYDPEAAGPVFDKFLREILPDDDVRDFVQTLFGVGLIGKVIEHVLPIFTGVGRNGKTTLLNVVRAALGDYAIEAEPDLLIDRDRAHPTGLLDLRGVRLAVSQESDEGRRLAVGTVKRLTGGDAIRARRMRENFVQFEPSHMSVLVTNHKPRVPGDDPALWRRLRVVPFNVVVPNPDTRLPDRLALELPAVVAWLLEGHRLYEENGMKEPDAVAAATDTYRTSSDVLGRFIDERCLVSPAAYVTAGDLFAAWTHWCQTNGEHAGRQNEFAQALDERGFERRRTSSARNVVGIGLYAEEE